MNRDLIIRTVDDETLTKVQQSTVAIDGQRFSLSKLYKNYPEKRSLMFTFFECRFGDAFEAAEFAEQIAQILQDKGAVYVIDKENEDFCDRRTTWYLGDGIKQTEFPVPVDPEWIEEDIEECVLSHLCGYAGAFCYLLSETQEELDAIRAEIEAYYKQKAEEAVEDEDEYEEDEYDEEEEEEEEEEEGLPPMQKRISAARWLTEEFQERAKEDRYEYKEFFYEPFDRYPHVNAFLQKMFPQIKKLLTNGAKLDAEKFEEEDVDMKPREQWAKDGLATFTATEQRMLKRLND